MPQKKIFLEKLTTINYECLVSPIILKHLKQILRADHWNQMKGWIILAQIGFELPISPNRYFLAKLTVTIVYQLYSLMPQNSKKSSNRKSRDRRLYNFGPIWVRVTSLKGNFLGKLTNIALVYCIPSRYVVSTKMSQSSSWK